MDDGTGEVELREDVEELRETLEELRSEVRDRPLRRPPGPQELLRFTREVTIPAVILVLRTNIESLKLLQRTLEMIEEGETSGGRLQERAEEVGRTALDQLEDTLESLQDVVSGDTGDDRAGELLSRAERLREDIETSLDTTASAESDPTTVDVDVDAELQAIKDDVEDDDGNRATGN